MKDAQFAKFALMVNGLVPATMLAWDAMDHQLGAHPSERAIHVTGTVALVFLLLSLSITPIRKITGYNVFSHFRRSLGLFAFFYAVAHLSLWFAVDRSLSFKSALDESISKQFIFIGMTTLLILLPLAATSTNAMIKRLGAARWKRLHSLAYVAGIGGVVHSSMAGKATTSTAMAFVIVLLALMAFRVVSAMLRRFKSRGPLPSA